MKKTIYFSLLLCIRYIHLCALLDRGNLTKLFRLQYYVHTTSNYVLTPENILQGVYIYDVINL